MKKVILTLLFIIGGACLLHFCSSSNKDEERKKEKTTINHNKQDEQLNITILLDLSDRIDPQVTPNTPEHYQRDITIVNELVNIFKEDIKKKGGFNAQGQLKVIFSPQPNDPNINQIASELNIDLSKIKEPIKKREIYENISENFTKNLERIYQTTIQSQNYIGSDIWRFFKNDVKDYCVNNDSKYRNILVIITDGYVYHERSKETKNNRTSYLLPTSIQSNGLRTPNWQEKFEQGDYGFISTRDDLENLEILVLEVNPSKNALNDEDVIKAYFGKWFKEMKVKNFQVYNTDLPEYTKKRIEEFIKNH